MQSRTYSPNPLGWIETELDKSHIDFLWKRIEESDGKSMKDNLIGNISKSFIIEDRADFFFKKYYFLTFRNIVEILMVILLGIMFLVM